MAGETFQKFGDSMNRVITKISVKTSSSLEKSKIKMHIDSLTKEVQKIYTSIGEEAYTLWLQGENATQSIIDKMETVKQKKYEIEQLNIELESIDARDSEILGTKTETVQEAEVPVSGMPHCPNCGAECEGTAKFCRKCGFKLQ